MKASDLFVESLESEGVEFIFGIPGEENLDFLGGVAEPSEKVLSSEGRMRTATASSSTAPRGC